MKKLALIAVMMMVCGTAFAGAVDPCRMTAFQFCAENMKVKGATGPNSEIVCTVNTRSSEFKACEESARNRCKAGEVLNLKQKAC